MRSSWQTPGTRSSDFKDTETALRTGISPQLAATAAGSGAEAQVFNEIPAGSLGILKNNPRGRPKESSL